MLRGFTWICESIDSAIFTLAVVVSSPLLLYRLLVKTPFYPLNRMVNALFFSGLSSCPRAQVHQYIAYFNKCSTVSFWTRFRKVIWMRCYLWFQPEKLDPVVL